jgi:hypothetical protein
MGGRYDIHLSEVQWMGETGGHCVFDNEVKLEPNQKEYVHKVLLDAAAP